MNLFAHNDAHMSRPTQAGFTLVEVLVAIAIFVLMSALAYGGLNSILKTRTHTDEFAKQLGDLQFAYRLISQDIRQTVLRPIRDEFGDEQAPFRGGGIGDYRLELTKMGWRNPAQQRRSTLQRVAYELSGDTLYRLYWPVLDRAQDSEPVRVALLTNIIEFRVRFYDQDLELKDTWPVEIQQDATGRVTHTLPLAAEVALELEGWGEFLWLLGLPA